MSFDNNNQFSDAGIMGKAEVKIGDTPFTFAGGNGSAGGIIGSTEGHGFVHVRRGLAQGAARTAVEQSFAMPLKAAGIDAKVTARFAGEDAR